MSSADAVRGLLAKSEAFLTSARENLSRGLYDVACFEADQAVQILLKALVLKLSGSFPRIHSLRTLLGELGRLAKKDNDVAEFLSENRARVIMLEDAYLRSRYAVEGYEAQDAEICLKVAEEVAKFAKTLVED